MSRVITTSKLREFFEAISTQQLDQVQVEEPEEQEEVLSNETDPGDLPPPPVGEEPSSGYETDEDEMDEDEMDEDEMDEDETDEDETDEDETDEDDDEEDEGDVSDNLSDDEEIVPSDEEEAFRKWREELRPTYEEALTMGHPKLEAVKSLWVKLDELANNQEFDKGLRVLRSLKIALLGVTKYDDVLAKADPEMAKLIEARRQAEKNYKEVVNDRNQGQMALETALAVFEKCDQEVKDRQAILNKRGIIPKQLGSEYKGEEKGEGWQAPEMRMTKYYSQEERKNSQLQVDEQGLVLDSEKRPMDGTLGYVMDVEGKKLHQFAKNNSTGLMEVTETGPRHVMVHHSTPLSGEEVVGAGYITFENGKIVSISNNSGHYKPGAVQLIQTVEELLKQGAFLDTTLAITEESRPLTDNARELYDKTVKAQKALENLVTEGFKRLETIHCLVQEVEEAKRNYNDLVGNGESQETLDTVWTKYLEIQRTLCEAVDRQLKDNEQLKQKAEAVMKAQKLLDKLGIGPKNKMTGKVEHYFGITDDMKGMQIRMDAPGNQVGVMEFLSSGGNSKGKPIIPEPHQDNDDYKLKVEETLDKEHERVDIKKEMHKQLLKDIVDIQKKMKITTRDDLETDAKERADVINVYLNELEHTGLPALKEVRECLKKSVDPDALKLYDHVDKRIRAFEEWLRKAPSEEELAEAIKALRGVPKTAPETVVRDIQEWVHVYDKSVGAYVRVKKDLGQGREDVGEMSEQDNSGETSEEG